jgi:hypothetical protein
MTKAQSEIVVAPTDVEEGEEDENYFWVEVSTERSVVDYAEPSFVVWHATIGFDDEDGKRTKIGRARIALTEDPGPGWSADLDAQEADWGEVAAVLSAADGRTAHALGEGPFGARDIAIVDHVHIKEPWRGKRLSHVLVDHALLQVCPWAVAALTPGPYDGVRSAASVKALQKHWRRAGFKRLRSGVYTREAREVSEAYKSWR